MLSHITLLTAETGSAVSGYSAWGPILWMVILLVAFYFILLRPQRKKEKKDEEMRRNIQIGDEIVTAGGIVGIVCKLEEKTLVIETGGDRSRIRIERWAVSRNIDAQKDDAEPKSVKPSKEEKSNEKEIEKKD